MRRNVLLATDSYKASHWLQYPSGTKGMFSYVEARKGDGNGNEVVFFGLQAILKDYLTTPITMDDVNEAAEIFKAHGEPFNYDGWTYIVKEMGGKLPVRIRAVAEGSVIPVSNVLMTIESTDPKVPWVASYLETLLLRVWYPTTVATRSYQAKKIIASYLDKTANSRAVLPFRLHDFGARGVSSSESAALGGMAHLVNFMGTDTVEALLAARRYYGADMAGFSIPAAEHSTITSWGKHAEVDAFRNMLTQYGKSGGIFAAPADSYDLKNAVDILWGGELRQEVIDSGATVVVRPDSGDALSNIMHILHSLANSFGCTVNDKGYRVLKHMAVIQGDGLDGPADINAILGMMQMAGFSAENIAFGMGGGLLQKLDRDTFGFAMKCSAILLGEDWRDVYKEAPGKQSKRGRLKLRLDQDGTYSTVRDDVHLNPATAVDALRTVYENGELLIEDTFEAVRARADIPAPSPALV